MIISVDELKEFIKTNKSDKWLEFNLLALESSIRKYTNNNFQNKNVRFRANVLDGVLALSTNLLKVGDTIQISQSLYNDGVYFIKEVKEGQLILNKNLIFERTGTPQGFVVTRIDYPYDVKLGVIEIMRWKIKNDEQNYDSEAKKDIQSETLSRHSVTYAKDTTEADINEKIGVPKKYCAFLRPYMKARFE